MLGMCSLSRSLMTSRHHSPFLGFNGPLSHRLILTLTSLNSEALGLFPCKPLPFLSVTELTQHITSKDLPWGPHTGEGQGTEKKPHTHIHSPQSPTSQDKVLSLSVCGLKEKFHPAPAGPGGSWRTAFPPCILYFLCLFVHCQPFCTAHIIRFFCSVSLQQLNIYLSI